MNSNITNSTTTFTANSAENRPSKKDLSADFESFTGIADFKKGASCIQKHNYRAGAYPLAKGVGKITIIALAIFGAFSLGFQSGSNNISKNPVEAPERPDPICHYGRPIASAWEEHTRRFNECFYKPQETRCEVYGEEFFTDLSETFPKTRGNNIWAETPEWPEQARTILSECQKRDSSFCRVVIDQLAQESAIQKGGKHLKKEFINCLNLDSAGCVRIWIFYLQQAYFL